ncbi:hypothetical protein EVAR_54036_1 [Eumeta japonica]|uniref:Uncharacterized protein n=1 Tax=Eumeta variegata TaxID=151549 RepID=A0A4C1YN38_EUMVA|nr:hypothetical protein EVAR_54036_1 [Eumeta japonica]
MGEIWFPGTKEQLLHSVSKLVEELNRPNPFKDEIPGRHGVYKHSEDDNRLEILQDPSRIFLCRNGQAVLARRGKKVSTVDRAKQQASKEQALEHAADKKSRLTDMTSRFDFKNSSNGCKKLVRKAYHFVILEVLNSMLTQTFVDRIENMEIRVVVGLQHPTAFKDAVVHALEVEVVRHEYILQRIQKIRVQEENKKKAEEYLAFF